MMCGRGRGRVFPGGRVGRERGVWSVDATLAATTSRNRARCEESPSRRKLEGAGPREFRVESMEAGGRAVSFAVGARVADGAGTAGRAIGRAGGAS